MLDSVLLKKTKYEERNAHNVFSLMLDPRCKGLHIVSSFIGCGQSVKIV